MEENVSEEEVYFIHPILHEVQLSNETIVDILYMSTLETVYYVAVCWSVCGPFYSLSVIDDMFRYGRSTKLMSFVFTSFLKLCIKLY